VKLDPLFYTMMSRIRSPRSIDNGTEEIVRVISFKTVNVFDISQTEGAELPNITPDQLQGEDGQELYKRLDELAEDEGLKITHYDLQGEVAEDDP
jgi:hypothetical protein